MLMNTMVSSMHTYPITKSRVNAVSRTKNYCFQHHIMSFYCQFTFSKCQSENGFELSCRTLSLYGLPTLVSSTLQKEIVYFQSYNVRHIKIMIFFLIYWVDNRLLSIYQYYNMNPRLSGQNCKFFKFLLSLDSQRRLEFKDNNTQI